MTGAIARLFAGQPRRAFEPGAPLFNAGSAVASVHFVLEGRCLLRRVTPDGAVLTLQVALPGTVLAESSVYSDRYHCDSVAAERSLVAVIGRPAFRAALAAAPDLAEDWSRMLAHGVQDARRRAEIRALTGVARRLDAWLGGGNVLPEKGRRQDVAAEIGVSREALYRELARRRST